MAGSMPINGMLYLALNSLIALVVAVLQATTINLQLRLRRNSVFLQLRWIISSLDF